MKLNRWCRLLLFILHIYRTSSTGGSFMRFYPAILCLLMTPNIMAQAPATALTSTAQTPYVEREERQFSFFPGGKIEIFAGAPGSLKIVGWQKASVRMEAEKIVYDSSPEEAKAKLQKSPIRVRYSQTLSSIRTSDAPDTNIEFNLTLYVPSEKTDIKTTIHHGDFSIEGVNGWVETTVATEGSIEAKSMSGYFSASTLRGDISAEMAGTRWRGLEFAARTQNGSATLKIPVTFSAALQLETRNGKILVDYPPQVVEGEVVPPDIIIRKTSQSLKASVGDGGAPIKLVTYSGNVTLSKKE
jgi:DUF4097 and DUF4098 domain-containing protein YvlB